MESLKLDLSFQRGRQVQDHVVHLCMVWVIGVFANDDGKCEQRDGGGKLPVGVTNFDNPYGPPGVRPFSCRTGGVQEIEFGGAALGQVVSKLKQREIAPTGHNQRTLRVKSLSQK